MTNRADHGLPTRGFMPIAYGSLIAASPDAFFVLAHTNAGLRIEDANPAAERLVGRSRAELLGRPLEGLGLGALLDERLVLVARDHEILDEELPWPCGDARRWLHLQAAPIDGGVSVLVRDITERVEAALSLRQREEQLRDLAASLEERVRARTAELETVNAELESFSYNVSHDLRAPLRTILGFTENVLLDATLSDESRAQLGRVRSAAGRMASIIDGLLALSRLSRAVLTPTHVDVSALAEEVVAELRRVAPTRQVRVFIEPGLALYGDPSLLRIVFVNLLGNAWKYTGRRAEAEIRVEAEGGELVVRDDGEGFDMRFVDKLFEPFERLHAGREFEGSGIGLALVCRIVHRHGGVIRAEGQPGAGASFHVSLPPAPEPAAAPDPGDEAPPAFH